jgi:hypothetical protein
MFLNGGGETMARRRVAIAVLMTALVLGGLVAGYRMLAHKAPPPQAKAPPAPEAPRPVEVRAGFAIFTQGAARVFSDPKYHNRSGDVYIESDNANIVRVKKENITWQQFFDTLPAPMKVQQDCLFTGSGQVFCNNRINILKFYKNGVRVNDLLTSVIQNGDKVLISFGGLNEDVSGQLSKVPNP